MKVTRWREPVPAVRAGPGKPCRDVARDEPGVVKPNLLAREDQVYCPSGRGRFCLHKHVDSRRMTMLPSERLHGLRCLRQILAADCNIDVVVQASGIRLRLNAGSSVLFEMPEPGVHDLLDPEEFGLLRAAKRASRVSCIALKCASVVSRRSLATCGCSLRPGETIVARRLAQISRRPDPCPLNRVICCSRRISKTSSMTCLLYTSPSPRD